MTTSNEHNNAPAVPQGEPEAYMVYGNYTRQPFRSIESAQAYMGGLLKSDPEGGYHIRPLFYATPAAPSQEPAVPQGWRDFLTELSKQKPEKPDYWSSCGQCERNSSTAEDLIAATPAPAPAQEVGLTDGEIKQACADIYLSDHPQGSESYDIALGRAIIAALRAKGHVCK